MRTKDLLRREVEAEMVETIEEGRFLDLEDSGPHMSEHCQGPECRGPDSEPIGQCRCFCPRC